jgi:hypothetical protein
MKLTYLIRSATQPETMVAAVPANTNWNKNFAVRGTPCPVDGPVDAGVGRSCGRAVVGSGHHEQAFEIP